MVASLHAFVTGLTWLDLFETVGCALSILGSELISRSNTDSKWVFIRFLNRHAKWGWVSYVGANLCMIIFGIILNRWLFVFTQAWFLKTSIMGITNHLWPTLAERAAIAAVQKRSPVSRFANSCQTVTSSENVSCNIRSAK